MSCNRHSRLPLELPPGTRFGIRQGVAWVRHLEGASLFLDETPLPVNELRARFPVTEHLWLTTTAHCQVSARETLSLVVSGDPWAGLMDFHRAVLDDIGRALEREIQERSRELESTVAGERSLVERFSARLAAVANECAAPPGPSSVDALLAACRAVGRDLGIEVRQPRNSFEESGTAEEVTLEAIARASGFHVRQVSLPQDWRNRRCGEPLLARLADETNRPVALIPRVTRGPFLSPGYDVFDPVANRRRSTLDRAVSCVAPVAWMFYRTLPDQRLKMLDLVQFSLPAVRRELRLVLLLAALAGLLGLAVPVASGVLVDQVIPEVGLPVTGMARLLSLCLFLTGLAVSAGIFQIIEGLTLLRMEGKIVPAVVPAIWDRLLRLPSRFFSGFAAGDLALRAMGLSLIFKKASSAVMVTLVTGLVSICNVGLLFWYSWRLAAAALALLGIMAAVSAMLLACQLRNEASIRRIEGSIIGFLLEVVGGITKLRTAGAENRAFAHWAERYADQLSVMIKVRRDSNRLHRFFSVYPIVIAMIIYLGTIYLDPNRLSPGDFLAFSTALANLVAAVLAVGFTLTGLLDLPPLYARVRPILEAIPEFPAAVIEPIRLGGGLALGGVSFRYPGQDEGAKVLDDVSLQARPGEFVAIVGASGSGKSTIMRLLLGFETPNSGTVTYDGRELVTLDPREVRRQIGVVLQHAELMPGDIFSNIVGFDSTLTMEDAWNAARLAGLDEDIRLMPMGMHTLVGEGGGNLAGGQRQRLLIARAVVRRPRILMFDEATSALDNTTQAVVTESITRELKGITRLVIAHRLATVMNADRIYVIKKGRVVQSGQYRQLITEPGPFQELVHRQAP